MTTALFLRQHIDFGFKSGVRRDRTRLGQYLTPLHFFALGATQQHPNVIARLTFVQQLAEHLHARAGRLGGVLDPHNLDLVAHQHLAAFNTTGHHRTATGNREHVFDRHQERLVDRPFRDRNVVIQRRQQLLDRGHPDLAGVPFQGL